MCSECKARDRNEAQKSIRLYVCWDPSLFSVSCYFHFYFIFILFLFPFYFYFYFTFILILLSFYFHSIIISIFTLYSFLFYFHFHILFLYSFYLHFYFIWILGNFSETDIKNCDVTVLSEQLNHCIEKAYCQCNWQRISPRFNKRMYNHCAPSKMVSVAGLHPHSTYTDT